MKPNGNRVQGCCGQFRVAEGTVLVLRQGHRGAAQPIRLLGQSPCQGLVGTQSQRASSTSPSWAP